MIVLIRNYYKILVMIYSTIRRVLIADNGLTPKNQGKLPSSKMRTRRLVGRKRSLWVFREGKIVPEQIFVSVFNSL